MSLGLALKGAIKSEIPLHVHGFKVQGNGSLSLGVARKNEQTSLADYTVGDRRGPPGRHSSEARTKRCQELWNRRPVPEDIQSVGSTPACQGANGD